MILTNTSLDKITNLSTLSKILCGITDADLANIPTNLKINTLINIVAAADKYGIDLSSSQVCFFFLYNQKKLFSIINYNISESINAKFVVKFSFSTS
jgi:hypothetical protein